MIFPPSETSRPSHTLRTSHEVLDYARALKDIVRLEPRIVNRDGEIAILLPGDDGYDD